MYLWRLFTCDPFSDTLIVTGEGEGDPGEAGDVGDTGEPGDGGDDGGNKAEREAELEEQRRMTAEEVAAAIRSGEMVMTIFS